MAQAVDVDEVTAAWNDICSDNPTNNFYLTKLKGLLFLNIHRSCIFGDGKVHHSQAKQ